jgi:hypothetical protein
MHSTDIAARRASQRSLGLATRCSLVDDGIAYSTIRARVACGVWAEPYRGVIDVTRQGWTWERRVLAAVLSAPTGTLASHATAAALHRFPGYERSGRIHLLAPRTGRNVELPHVLHSTVLPDPGTEVDSVPCTTPVRTLHLLAGAGDADGLARSVRAVLRRGWADAATLLDDRLAAAPGYAFLARAVAAEVTNLHRVDSWLEEAWVDRLLDWDLPPFVTQHPLRVEGHHYRLDVAWPDHDTCLEGDGDGFHGDLRSQDRDGRRGSRVARAGWRTIHVGVDHLRDAPAARVRRRLATLLSR